MPFYGGNRTRFERTIPFILEVFIMLENKFKQGLTKELKERFPGCVVVHLDPNEVQGHPDLLVLYGSTWAALEGKRSANAPHRPNQDYYVRQMKMCIRDRSQGGCGFLEQHQKVYWGERRLLYI